MTSKLRGLLRHRRDERGDALSAAILYLGVMLTILIGVHVLIIAMARTAVQSAADAAVAAAQVAPDGIATTASYDCAVGDELRACEGRFAARLAMAATDSSAAITRDPVVVVEEDKGIVSVLVFGGTISPVFGGIELTALACAPLDSVEPSKLTAADSEVWRC